MKHFRFWTLYGNSCYAKRSDAGRSSASGSISGSKSCGNQKLILFILNKENFG